MSNVRFVDGRVLTQAVVPASATSASHASIATSASYAEFATSASYAISSSHEIIKEVSSSHADTALSASYALTASYALNAGSNVWYDGTTFISSSLPIKVDGPITASGGISASGKLYAYGADFADQNIQNITYADVDAIRSDADTSTTLNMNSTSIVGSIGGNDSFKAESTKFYVGEEGGIDLIAGRHITASGDISGSGDLIINNITASGDVVLDEDQRIYFEADKGTYIESHASDTFRVVVNDQQMFLLDEDTGNRAVFGNGTKVFIGANNNKTPVASLHVAGDIWASGSNGNITASGDISASVYYGDGSQLTGITTGFWTGSNGKITRDSDVEITGSLYNTSDIYIGGAGGSAEVKLIHNGDTDTYLLFDQNHVNLVAGGLSVIKFDKTLSHDRISINNTNDDLDTQIMGQGGDVLLHVDAAGHSVGIATSEPPSSASAALTVEGSISASGGVIVEGNVSASKVYAADGLYHSDNANTYLKFPTGDKFQLNAGDVNFIYAHQVDADINKLIINDDNTDTDIIFRGAVGSNNNLLRLDASEMKIGIGTSVPSASLHIAGNLWVSGSNGHITASGNISASGTIISEDGNIKNNFTVGGDLDIADTIYHTGDSNTKIRFPEVDTISFHTSGEDRFRIDPSGHITASGNISSSAISTASFGTYLGDGSNLTGITAATSLTQSLFVSPSGDNSTAVVGDLHLPFKTILSATASANIGDTIIVYPGTYLDETANIVKDGVNYYFYPGAFVSSSDSRIIYTGDLTYPINFRGNGSFETNIDDDAFSVSAPRGVFEFDLIHHKGMGSIGTGKDSLTISQPSSTADAEILEVRGSVMSSDGGNGPSATLGIGYGNTKFDGSVVHSGSLGQAIEIRNIDADTQINAYAYAKAGSALNSQIRAKCTQFSGHLETGDQETYHAIYLAGGYVEGAIIHGEIIGAMYLSVGGNSNTGVVISGFQRCANSPSSLGAVDIRSGNHVFNQKIQTTENVFYQTGSAASHAIFNGQVQITSDNTGQFFDFYNPNGVFIYNGSSGDTNIRANSNTINAGTLIIDSYLEHYGSSSPANKDCFDLSGGTLEINNKVKFFQDSSNSGIVNMTGGYLKLNGAQLIHNDPSSANHCILLNDSSHSGSIFNNSFTNIPAVFQSGSFTNEITGGGTLFYSDNLY